MFIEPVPDSELGADAAQMYDAVRDQMGFVPNFVRVFSHRPDVYAAWQALNVSIKGGMDLRRYELATLAAARRLRSSYCMLAHGQILAEKFLDADAVRALASDGDGDGDGAGLDAADRAVMALAEKIADDATAVTQADIDGLRDHGLGDDEILSVILAACARCFFSKVLDAAGAQPDHRFAALDPAFRDALTVGRPIAPA